MMELADILAAELRQIEVGGAKVCADTCECHGGYVCRRMQHQDDVPHVGFQDDGSLIQWAAGTCGVVAPLDEQAIAVDRAAATRALLEQIDPALLIHLLKIRGYL